eukprot:COSAG01_NODE_22985_length_833_cov_1.336512_1_plen_146_part_00
MRRIRWWTRQDEAVRSICVQLQAQGPVAGGAAEVSHMFHYNSAPAVVRPLPTAAAATSLPPPAAATALLFGSRGMMGPAAAEALGNEVGLDLIVTDLADAAEVLLDEAQLNRKRGEFVHHQTGGMKRSARGRGPARVSRPRYHGQ